MDTLKNGATVIEQTGDVVLAKTEGFHPYVTWAIDSEGDTYWGHYFATLSDAIEDYQARTINHRAHNALSGSK